MCLPSLAQILTVDVKYNGALAGILAGGLGNTSGA